MISHRKLLITNNPGVLPIEAPYSWIDAKEITRDDITRLTEEFGVDSEFLADVLDQDEQSRIEKEDDHIQLIIKLPVKADEDDDNSQVITTLGIMLYADKILTICQNDSIVLEDLEKNRYRQYPLTTKEGFVLSILGRATQVFIRLLKTVNRQKNKVEDQFQKHGAVMNFELMQLLEIQKSLVYFSTSLASNQALMEKLQKTSIFLMNNEEEREFLSDSIIDNSQAVAMANIYSNILNETMDAFSNVISNNMNIVMKRLTLISLSLMFPTFITSFWGMNIKLPLANNPFAWAFLAGACLIVAMIGMFILSDKKNRFVQREVNQREISEKRVRKEKIRNRRKRKTQDK